MTRQRIAALAMAMLLLAAARCGTGPANEDANAALGLRNMILTSDMSGASAVVMDAHTGDHVTSLMSSSDGDASIYLSNGGAMLGGGEHPPVRALALAFTREVLKQQAIMQPTTELPFPAAGNVRIYLRTAGRTSFVEAPESELAGGAHTFSAAYRAGQQLLAEYRKMGAAAL